MWFSNSPESSDQSEMPPTLYPTPLPDSVTRDPRRGAEVQVYRGLAESLAGQYAVFYSVAWLGKSRAEGPAFDGEADFVIAHPKRGLLVLEVKGGEIIYDGPTGKWASRDAQGNIHDIKDPFAQAMRSKKALLSKFREMRISRGKWIPMAHGVCFPKALKGKWTLRPDAPPEIIIDHDDMAQLKERVEAIYDHWGGDEGGASSLGGSGMDAVRNLLARSHDLRLPLGRRIGEESREFIRLTEAQFNLLDYTCRHRRAAVHGGAGTGKTLLAVEKARRLASEGFRTLLTCFNIPLETHLRAEAGDTEGLTIQRFHTLCQGAVRDFDLPYEIHPPNHPSDIYWNEEMPQALLDAVDAGLEKFDAIVVDEGQDFHDLWWLPLRLCLNDPDEGILYVFLDGNQRLYGPGADFLNELPPFDLPENLRNTRTIYEMAKRFYGGADIQPVGPEGRPPEIIPLASAEALEETLGRVLRRLIQEEQIPHESIAVLLGQRPDRVGLQPGGKLGAYPLTDAERPQPGHVTLDTIHRFKGLDSAVVILAGLEGMHPASAETLLYVGITRARSHLVILGQAEVLAQWGLGG